MRGCVRLLFFSLSLFFSLPSPCPQTRRSRRCRAPPEPAGVTLAGTRCRSAMARLQVRTHRCRLPPCLPSPCPSSSHGMGSGGHAGGSAQAAPGVGTGLCPALQRRGWPEGDATPLRASSPAGSLGESGMRGAVSFPGQYLASPWFFPVWAPRCHGFHRSWHRAVLVTALAGDKPGTGRFAGSCVGRS